MFQAKSGSLGFLSHRGPRTYMKKAEKGIEKCRIPETHFQGES